MRPFPSSHRQSPLIASLSRRYPLSTSSPMSLLFLFWGSSISASSSSSPLSHFPLHFDLLHFLLLQCIFCSLLRSHLNPLPRSLVLAPALVSDSSFLPYCSPHSHSHLHPHIHRFPSNPISISISTSISHPHPSPHPLPPSSHHPTIPSFPSPHPAHPFPLLHILHLRIYYQPCHSQLPE